MKALVFKGIGNIALEVIPEPFIRHPRDVIVKLTRSAICGTDLHIIRGTMPGAVGKGLFSIGTVLGHEGVGTIEQVGPAIKNFQIGDRVVIPSTISCGECEYCLKKIYSQCDKANPHGRHAGTVFFGGPGETGPLDGMQAEKVRVPFADTTLIALPDDVSDDQAILLSDIVPTAYMAVEMAGVETDDTVAVFGCGPVGQLVIACLKQFGVQSIFAIDTVPARLEMAQNQGAYVIDFNHVDPVNELRKITNDRGPTKIIDAVGIDAEHPSYGFFAFFEKIPLWREFRRESRRISPEARPWRGNWIPGNGPSQVLRWAVKAIAKAGTISIIGVYPSVIDSFPIGESMNKNLTLKMGCCNHRAYIPTLLDWVRMGRFDPLPFITNKIGIEDIVEAYKHFDKRDDDWIKVVIAL